MLLPRILFLVIVVLTQLVLCSKEYYNILGVSKSASDKELKSAYRRLSKKHHPDKNPGDKSAEQKFVEVSEAYEVLSDPKQRRLYDQLGYDAFTNQKQQGGGGGGFRHHDPFDLFNQFFGGGGHFEQAQQRGRNAELRVSLPLADFYLGRTTEIEWEKQHICEKCQGSGSEDGKVTTCERCKGHGMLIMKHMIAPGMFQQVQAPCDACRGQGSTIARPCTACAGNKVVRKTSVVPLTVEPGVAPGHRLLFENEADAHPDYVAGDLIVTLVEADPAPKHNAAKVDGYFFRRKGQDLYWTEVLSLREAWMGDWTRNLTHLDGHIVRLSRPRGQVVQPGHVETINGEGMPVYAGDGEGGSVLDEPAFGKLFVEYLVVLPDLMESGMEKDFWATWEKWRAKFAVDLHKDSGRPDSATAQHDEL